MTLFEPLKLRDVVFKNRIAVSPMCEYSAIDGVPNAWHVVHLGSRAVGGAGLVFTEATAVEARGRISPDDTGLYTDAQVDAWKPITEFIVEQGSIPGIQLAHAGRKASTASPWKGGKAVVPADGGWTDVVSSSPTTFTEGYLQPSELDRDGIASIVAAFRAAAVRSLEAGFQVVEIHAAHGYLINQFLSPLVNHRTDEYGGSFENRTRFAREVVEAVRTVWPERLPLFIRVSASDWAEGGWDVEQSVRLAQMLKPLGVDLIDASSGGAIATAKIEVGPGYQVPFAERIRKEAEIPTGAVGMITEPRQAEEILATGKADLIFLARELLRDPYWPRRAAKELGFEIHAPKQYGRAW